MKAMILAAGLGTRLRPYTDHTPKPLFTISQRPLLALTIDRLRQSGCTAIIINTHHLHQQIDAFVAGQAFGLPVITRYEPQILGTGGGIRNIADWWQEDLLLVINADIVCDIDLAQVIACHRRHGQAVTMVMHEHPQFDNVWVDGAEWVTSFDAAPAAPGSWRRMAFTGIHLLDRRVLEFIPCHGFAGIIDAYRRLLAGGGRIKAYISRTHYWRDIGTPQSYQAAAFEQMAPAAFEAAFGLSSGAPIQRQALHGDGSDRRWFRLAQGPHHLIMVDHGIRSSTARQEVDAYVSIGRHLHASGIPVPRIHLFDAFAGLVFLEDLGDCHLQHIIRAASADEVRRWYQRVIDGWLDMAFAGGEDFDIGWTYQSTHYDRELILEREARYFCEAFLRDYIGHPVCYDDLETEFETLADAATASGVAGFIHRDLQSRNIMVQGDRFGFIDFQGGRIGPIQYDLASLLIDPYVALPLDLQIALRAYAAEGVRRRQGVALRPFITGYELCAVTRNLQMLGAFAFLSRVKGKHVFESYIPRALKSLQLNLAHLTSLALPKLTATIADVARKLPSAPTPEEAKPHESH
jgi:aminoglycoside/choline kinase family phosphotransferase/dTDP-glucose pyrophosphorylase